VVLNSIFELLGVMIVIACTCFLLLCDIDITIVLFTVWSELNELNLERIAISEYSNSIELQVT